MLDKHTERKLVLLDRYRDWRKQAQAEIECIGRREKVFTDHIRQSLEPHPANALHL